MFPSSPHTSALAGAGRAARPLDAALCNCPLSSHLSNMPASQYFWFTQLLHYVLFLTHHTSWHLHWIIADQVLKLLYSISSAPMFLARARLGWAVRPPGWMLLSVTVTVSPTSPPQLWREWPGRGRAWRAARHRTYIIHLFYRRDMKIIYYWATATALQQHQQNQECFPTTNTHMHIYNCLLFICL